MHGNNRLQIQGGNYFCGDKCGGVNLFVMLYLLSWMTVHGNLSHYTTCQLVSLTYFKINSKYSKKKKKSNISNKPKIHFDYYSTPNSQHTPEVLYYYYQFLSAQYIQHCLNKWVFRFYISDDTTHILLFNIMSCPSLTKIHFPRKLSLFSQGEGYNN